MSDKASDSEIMTVDEVAEYVRVSPKKIYEWAQNGEIPCGKLGNNWRFRRSEVKRWLAKKLGAPKRMSAPAMALGDALTPKRVLILDEDKKEGVLNRLIDCLASDGGIANRGELAEAIFQREELMSTGIGLGIAVPHARINSVSKPTAAVALCRRPIVDYDSLDGAPVRLVFMIVAGREQHPEYLRLLAEISRRIKDESLRNALFAARSPEELYALLTSG